MFEEGETVEFGGKIISHMAANSKIMNNSCRVVSAADYANKYGITDIDGKKMTSTRAFNVMGKYMLPKFLQGFSKSCPSSIIVPSSLLTVMTSKYYKF
jgi:hypothetical protein